MGSVKLFYMIFKVLTKYYNDKIYLLELYKRYFKEDFKISLT